MTIILAAYAAVFLATQVVLVAVFVRAGDRVLERHATERRELYQRIQAPEVAVTQAIEAPDGPGYIAPDDDAGYWDHVRELTHG